MANEKLRCSVSSLSLQTPEDFLRAMREGAKSRATASTNMNEHSSRSHLVMTVRIHSHNARTGAKTSSRISFVDLAGSERLAKSQAEGARMKEAISINKSLSALGDVINALASKQSRSHIPYRCGERLARNDCTRMRPIIGVSTRCFPGRC